MLLPNDIGENGILKKLVIYSSFKPFFNRNEHM